MTGRQPALERLRRAPFLDEEGVRTVFALCDGERGGIRAVGGAVRDTLMGRGDPGMDVDFATDLVPRDVMARAQKAGIGAVPTGIAHGTVTLVVDGCGYEVTTLRRDVATDGRHAEVAFGTDWTEDARRRDFTLNALYCGPDGELFDPLGGLEDCLAGRVRFIGDPSQRIAEDRLRVYRFFRFSARLGGQKFDTDGLRAVAEAAGTLDLLSAERVGAEMVGLLGLKAVYKTLLAMVKAGVLALSGEVLDSLADYEERCEAPSVAGRLALLTGEHALSSWQQQWRLSNALVSTALGVERAATLLQEGQINRAVYRHADVVAEAVGVAAARGRWSTDWQADVRRAVSATKPPPFPVRGADIVELGVPAGPELGKILARLEADWIESGFALTREELLALARGPSGDR